MKNDSLVPTFKNIEIEYLRAIAIIFTLIHHAMDHIVIDRATTGSHFSGITFWGGVDLFFAISGFVIMTKYRPMLETKNQSQFQFKTQWQLMKNFWLRRQFRILPGAIFWLVVYLFFTIYFNFQGSFGILSQNINDATSALFQYANFYGIKCWGHPKAMECGPNGIYWSLSLEEQFYFLLPLVIYFLKNRFFPFILSLGLVQFFWDRTPWSLGWAIRSDAILWGTFLAYSLKSKFYKKLEPLFIIRGGSFLSFSFLCIFIFGMMYLPAEKNNFAYSTGILALICSIMVWLSSYQKQYLFIWTPAWLSKILVWIGTRSYSIYLVHIIVFRFTWELAFLIYPKMNPLNFYSSLMLLSISVPTMIFVSDLSFKYIETPFRNYGRTKY